MLSKLVQCLRKYCKSKAQVTSVSLTDKGLRFSWDDGSSDGFHWVSVKQIYAYKEDLFSVDRLCLGFRVDDNGFWWKIHEEMDCWEDVLAVVNKRFGINHDNWFCAVAFPAFATKFTHLWGEEFEWKE